jgi:hypothetical protein
MNIFVLDYDPVTAAEMYCDKHVPKMVVELYQQLGSAQRRHGATDDMMPLTSKGTPLKGGYHNHPCTLWCGESYNNYLWAALHAITLCNEYSFRYNKKHACHEGIRQLYKMADNIPGYWSTPFAQAMPDEYHNSNAVLAYRTYYKNDKVRFAKWEKGRKQPYWW